MKKIASILAATLVAVVATVTSVTLATFATGASAQPSPAKPAPKVTAKAIFAGGCFWCMEAPFDTIDGVLSTTSGYTAGQKKNPTYAEVSAGGTGHTEAVQIEYDPAKVTYEKLLHVFWRNIDPTTTDRQFCDGGSQYRSGVYYLDNAQRDAAMASKTALEKNKPFRASVVTEIVAATQFYPAEEYHQNYYLKNPIRYKIYRSGCGRDARLKELWGNEAGGVNGK